MSNFDGQAEKALIVGQISSLCGGRVRTNISDTDNLAMPYIYVLFGTPIPKASDRSLGKETAQPHILPVTIASVGADVDTVDAVSAAALNKLLSFAPNDNASGLTSSGGNQFPTKDANGATIRVTKVLLMQCVINMMPVF